MPHLYSSILQNTRICFVFIYSSTLKATGKTYPSALFPKYRAVSLCPVFHFYIAEHLRAWRSAPQFLQRHVRVRLAWDRGLPFIVQRAAWAHGRSASPHNEMPSLISCNVPCLPANVLPLNVHARDSHLIFEMPSSYKIHNTFRISASQNTFAIRALK